MDLSDLLIPIVGDVNGSVRHGDIVIVRQGKMQLKLRRGNPLKKEDAEIFKLLSPEVLSLLGDKLEGAEVFVRVRATGATQEGNDSFTVPLIGGVLSELIRRGLKRRQGYAFIIPPDEENSLEIYRGKIEEEAKKKAQGSKRVFNGGLFMEIDEETIAEIIETAESL